MKRPDAHWRVKPHMLLSPQLVQNPFNIDPVTNQIAPQLVFEVAVSNESMPTTDLNRYFGPGTGTRAWIGIKVFKNANSNGYSSLVVWMGEAKDCQWSIRQFS